MSLVSSLRNPLDRATSGALSMVQYLHKDNQVGERINGKGHDSISDGDNARSDDAALVCK
jgi:hypothetical protein